MYGTSEKRAGQTFAWYPHCQALTDDAFYSAPQRLDPFGSQGRVSKVSSTRQRHANKSCKCVSGKGEGDGVHAAPRAQIRMCEPFRRKLLTAEPKQSVNRHAAKNRDMGTWDARSTWF
jgi:hypothetical protein